MSKFPFIVEQKLKHFKPHYQEAFLEEYKRKKKSVFIGYLLLIPLGWHYAYLKKWGSQILCIVTLWGFLLWWLVDWFRISSLVKDYNDNIALELMKSYAWNFSESKTNWEKDEKLTKAPTRGSNMTINELYKNSRRSS
jgi:hypothetical protein|tara:strand:+ start:74 stop:487 length:414 start_codon:yes stop_codon:yes gene_type:complete